MGSRLKKMSERPISFGRTCADHEKIWEIRVNLVWLFQLSKRGIESLAECLQKNRKRALLRTGSRGEVRSLQSGHSPLSLRSIHSTAWEAAMAQR